MAKCSIIFGIVLASFVLGCSPSTPADDGEASLVEVCGKVLTPAMARERVAAVIALRTHRKPDLSVKDVEKFRSTLDRTLPSVFVKNAVIGDYAAKNGVTLSEDALAQHRELLFKSFKTKKDRSYEAFAEALGDVTNVIDQMVREEALSAAVSKHLATVAFPTNIPMSYADEVIAEMEAHNRAMALTNQLAFARATNAWVRLKAGEPFEKVADLCTELESERHERFEWGSFTLDDLAHEPEVVKNLKTFKPGQFSGPMEADNGLMIMRFDKVEPNDAGEREYTISRIFFKLPFYYSPAPKEKIVEAAYERYEKALFNQKLTEMIKAANPVYRNVVPGR